MGHLKVHEGNGKIYIGVGCSSLKRKNKINIGIPCCDYNEF